MFTAKPTRTHYNIPNLCCICARQPACIPHRVVNSTQSGRQISTLALEVRICEQCEARTRVYNAVLWTYVGVTLGSFVIFMVFWLSRFNANDGVSFTLLAPLCVVPLLLVLAGPPVVLGLVGSKTSTHPMPLDTWLQTREPKWFNWTERDVPTLPWFRNVDYEAAFKQANDLPTLSEYEHTKKKR